MKGRVFIVAPNIGLHMGVGGGVKVTLAMAKSLEESGYEPYLIALRGYNTHRLLLIHGVKLFRTTPLYFLGEGESLRLPFHTQISLLRMFLEKAFVRYRPQVIIFNDDVPMINERLLKEVNLILYSHFPYAARIKYNITDVYEIPPSMFKIYLEILYRKFLKNLIYIDYIPSSIMLLSNSAVTRTFINMMWGKNSITLYPPLIVSRNITTLPQDKEDFVLVLATIQPNKRIGDVIKAFSKLKHDKARLIIAGYRGPKSYMKYLNNLIKQTNIVDRVIFMVNVDEHKKWFLLAKSKVIISAAHFEPFGINVVEGMYANNIPIVYRGPLSGPWIDIIDRGKYGLGFRDINELTELMDIALKDYNYMVQTVNPFLRAKKYCYELFSEQFIKIVSSII